MSVLTVSSYAAPALFAQAKEEIKVSVTFSCFDQNFDEHGSWEVVRTVPRR